MAIIDLGRYQLGWSDKEDYVYKPKKGLSETVIREMSEMKNEPAWMLEFRLRVVQAVPAKADDAVVRDQDARARLRRHLLLHQADELQVDAWDSITRKPRLSASGDPLAGLLVWSGEEKDFYAAAGEQLPGKRLLLEFAAAVAVGQIGMNFGERNSAARRIFFVDAAGKDGGLALEAGMMEQQPGQFGAGVPGNSYNSGLNRFRHDSSIVLSLASTSPARRGSGQITSTVSSPATVPTTSGHSS